MSTRVQPRFARRFKLERPTQIGLIAGATAATAALLILAAPSPLLAAVSVPPLLLLSLLAITGLLRQDAQATHALYDEARQVESRYRAAVANSLDAFFVLRAVQGEDGMVKDFDIIEANAQAGALMKAGDRTLIGRRWGQMFPESRTDGDLARIAAVYHTGHTFAEETYFSRDADDESSEISGWFYRQVVPTNDGVAVMIRDVTRRKQQEQQQTEIIVERERVAMLTKVMSKLSHDIRTPLTVLKMSAHLLGRGLPPDKAAHHREQINVQVERLDEMLRSMTTMTRLEQPTDIRHYARVHLDRFVSHLLADYGPQAQQAGQRLRFVGADDSLMVLADPNRLKLALHHLIDNALRYTPQGGEICVSVSREDGQAVIAVQDTGQGIPAHTLPRIFEHFYRGDTHRPVDRGSTGLGLAITQKIVTAHKGKIDVQSRVGEGSTFRVRLPLLAQASRLETSA